MIPLIVVGRGLHLVLSLEFCKSGFASKHWRPITAVEQHIFGGHITPREKEYRSSRIVSVRTSQSDGQRRSVVVIVKSVYYDGFIFTDGVRMWAYRYALACSNKNHTTATRIAVSYSVYVDRRRLWEGVCCARLRRRDGVVSQQESIAYTGTAARRACVRTSSASRRHPWSLCYGCTYTQRRRVCNAITYTRETIYFVRSLSGRLVRALVKSYTGSKRVSGVRFKKLIIPTKAMAFSPRFFHPSVFTFFGFLKTMCMTTVLSNLVFWKWLFFFRKHWRVLRLLFIPDEK